jgi:hypothetical protein
MDRGSGRKAENRLRKIFGRARSMAHARSELQCAARALSATETAQALSLDGLDATPTLGQANRKATGGIGCAITTALHD